MSKRNLILLIIILSLGTIVFFGFLYFNKPTNTTNDNTQDTNFFSQFGLFGTKKPPITIIPPKKIPDQPNPPENTQNTKLNKISSMPIAGFTIFNKERLKNIPAVTTSENTGAIATTTKTSTPTVKTKKPTPPPTEFVPALRYVEKATGNVYQTFIDKIEERKFSTTIIPKVYDAYFGNNGESVFMRYLKLDGRTIETFLGTLPKELLGGDTTENNEIKGVFLPNNITDISISPDSSGIFYLFNNQNNGNENIIGTTLNLKTNKKIQIFDSPFTEWLSSWPNKDIVTLTTKPSASIPGYMYSMDASGKNLTKILGDINGLTTLESPNGKLILFSNTESSYNLTLNLYHTDTRNSDLLSLKTLPEKCVWNRTNEFIYCAVPKSAPIGEYPDTWYQGEVSFNDQIWKIEVKTGNTTLILDPSTSVGGEDIDGIKLALDADENNLFFVNKKDYFLWRVSLK
ncbi:MAG: hypothetical protein WCG28_03310 [bacterium]